jgi:chemotaxis response regulator CheB
MRRPVRVLVVDDSPTMASALSALLTEDARIEVVGCAGDGQRAVTLARLLRPDVITMDLLLPAMDGTAAIERIMMEAPTRILVVSGLVDEGGASRGFEAMRAGALELIGKPVVASGEELRRWGRQLAESVCLVSEIPVVTRRTRPTPPLPAAGAPGWTCSRWWPAREVRRRSRRSSRACPPGCPRRCSSRSTCRRASPRGWCAGSRSSPRSRCAWRARASAWKRAACTWHRTRTT